MRKGIVFLISIFLFHQIALAVGVTFQVDMSNETVSPLGVHLAGSFTDGNGDGIIDNNLPNWNPGGIAMNDNGNGIWSVTIEIVSGLYEYKFVNGNDWSDPEFFSSESSCAQWVNGNRFIEVGELDLVLPIVCWNECVACGLGCMDVAACNYDVNATVEGPCTYPDFIPEIVVDQPSFGCFSNGVKLYPNGGDFSQIGWGTSPWNISSVSDTLIIFGNVSQDFYFIGTEASGCVVNVGPINVQVNTPEPVAICLVTVDLLSGKNHILWEPIVNEAVQSIVVFKESGVQDVFEVIGEVDYTAEGAFEDVNSNPQVQSNRYRIGMKDSCGFVYAPSDGVHKTIHLTTSSGMSGNVNLNWNAYEGVVFDSYNIYRGSSAGIMNLIATVASNVLSYTDINPNTDERNYMIEVVGVSCNPNRSVIFSRSNILNLSTLEIGKENAKQISIYPNPASTRLDVELYANDLGNSMMILNSMGEIVWSTIITSTHTSMNIEQLPNGLYYLRTENLVRPFQVVR
jgi:hypothetical protein